MHGVIDEKIPLKQFSIKSISFDLAWRWQPRILENAFYAIHRFNCCHSKDIYRKLVLDAKPEPRDPLNA